METIDNINTNDILDHQIDKNNIDKMNINIHLNLNSQQDQDIITNQVIKNSKLDTTLSILLSAGGDHNC